MLPFTYQTRWFVITLLLHFCQGTIKIDTVCVFISGSGTDISIWKLQRKGTHNHHSSCKCVQNVMKIKINSKM